MSQTNVIKSYDLKRVEELTGLSRSQVRTLVSKGILKPTIVGRKHYFSYLDLTLFKEIKTFFDQNISKKHMYRDLQAIRKHIEADTPLSSVSFREIESRLYVNDGSHLFNPTTGDGQLDLPMPKTAAKAPQKEPPGTVLEFRKSVIEDEEETTWYNLALEMEAQDRFEEAISCYKKELETNVENFDAYLNLGRLYQLVDENFVVARSCYETVLAHYPEDPLANFNLGTIFEMLNQMDDAITHYDKAYTLPDAYFNKGRLFEYLGRREDAEEQFRIYDQLIENQAETDEEDPRD